MNKLLLVAICGLAGCSTLPGKQPAPVEVKVAVPVSCVKEVPERPAYETETLPDTAADGTVVIALSRDWARSRTYESQLEIVVAGCK